MRLFATAPFILHVFLHHGVRTHQLGDMFAGELVIFRHLDNLDVGDLKELFLINKHLLYELFVKVLRRRRIVLQPIEALV